MPRNQQHIRTRLANQIYRTPWGCEARVKHRGKIHTQFFDGETPISRMQRWQLDTKDGLDLGLAPIITPRGAMAQRRRSYEAIRLRDERERTARMAATPTLVSSPAAPPVTSGPTLEARIESFFPQIQARASFKADRSHLRAWITAPGADGVALGKKAAAAITTADLNVVINAWRTPPPAGKPGQPRAVRRITVMGYARDGKVLKGYARTTPTTSGPLVVAIKTVRHRCRVLKEFFAAEGVPTNVIDDAKIPAREKTHPIGVEIATIHAVAVALAKYAAPPPVGPKPPTVHAINRAAERRKTYARYVVLNTTAQRPCQVMRALPDDVKLDAKIWVVRSAKGAPAHTITLNKDMVKAWRVFIAADAWGTYDTSKHANQLHVCGWPTSIRPYNARHSIAIDALHNHGVHLDDVQGIMGHEKIDTTRQFYGPLVIDRQRHISNKIDGRMKDVFDPRLVKGKRAK